MGLTAWLCLIAALVTTGATAAPPVPVDVVFVLDNSGSMKTNDPRFLTREAVLGFAATLAEDSEVDGRMGLVLFDEEATLAQPLTSVAQLISGQDLERALRSLDFSGQRTHSPAGIERALYELRNRGREGARKAIVFLSDGKIDTGDPRNDLEVARWLKEDLASESEAEEVRIFGIAFTESADYQLMQALARRTRARYYRAFEADELPSVVADVLAKVDEAPVYDLAYLEPLDRTNPADRSADAAPTAADFSTLPDVSSSPLREEPGIASRLISWLPLALLVVGGAYYWRSRSQRRFGLPWRANAGLAPPAQLLDPGGVLGDAGAALPLKVGRTTIGRDPSNDIVLEDDTISSEHAAIEVHDGRYWLLDLRSTNGTRHADRKLAHDERAALKGGDHVRFAEIDLMFVIEGYVPGGATVYLSSSASPPADWSVLAESTDQHPMPRADHTDHTDQADQAGQAAEAARAEHDSPAAAGASEASEARAEPDRRALDDAPSQEIYFAEHRERLDPASVLDLDEELGSLSETSDTGEVGAHPPVDPIESAAFDAAAVARAEDALARVQDQEAAEGDSTDSASTSQTPRLSLLSDPEDAPTAPIDVPRREDEDDIEAEDEEPTTPSLPDAEDHAALCDERDERDDTSTDKADAATHDPLRRCLDLHLTRVAALSPAFADFVEQAFHPELRDALPVAARDLLRDAAQSGHIEQRSYTFDRVRYLICGVPSSMDAARERFGADYGGFTRVLTEQLQADSFRTERCKILAVLSFGAEDALDLVDANPETMSGSAASGATRSPWVSLTIVPDEGQDPRIDLLSYEFLTEAERAQIEPSLDHEISQSGLA